MYIHTCIYIIYTDVYIYIYTYTYIIYIIYGYIYIYIYIRGEGYIYIYIYIYIIHTYILGRENHFGNIKSTLFSQMV